jgi:F0F1-type ATP synthase assembly protein I
MDAPPWGLILTILGGMLSAILFKKKQGSGKDKKSKQTLKPSSKSKPIEPSGSSIPLWFLWGVLACVMIGLLLLLQFK